MKHAYAHPQGRPRSWEQLGEQLAWPSLQFTANSSINNVLFVAEVPTYFENPGGSRDADVLANGATWTTDTRNEQTKQTINQPNKQTKHTSIEREGSEAMESAPQLRTHKNRRCKPPQYRWARADRTEDEEKENFNFISIKALEHTDPPDDRTKWNRTKSPAKKNKKNNNNEQWRTNLKKREKKKKKKKKGGGGGGQKKTLGGGEIRRSGAPPPARPRAHTHLVKEHDGDKEAEHHALDEGGDAEHEPEAVHLG